MTASTDSRPDRDSALEVFNMFSVGLGMLTMVLFPFVIPGVAILVLFALPLLPLLLPVLALLLVAVLVRAMVRLGRGVGRLVRPSKRPSPGYERAAARAMTSST